MVLLGTGLVIVAVVVLAIRWHSLLLIRRLPAAPRLTCAELSSAGRLPRRVLVSGRTVPGPAGPSSRPAIWSPASGIASLSPA